MANPTRYVVKSGETFLLTLSVVAGSTSDKSIVSSVAGSLKKAPGPGLLPDASAPVLATFNVSDTADGWVFRLGSGKTSTLAPGIYVMDAKLVLTSNEVLITDPVQVEVRGSVS